MEELSKFSVEQADFNVKKHYMTEKGREIRLDYFIFTVYEEELNARGLGALQAAIPKRFPPALAVESKSDERPDELQLELLPLIDRMFAWYTAEFPVLSSNETLDYTKHAEFLYPFVYMMIDLGLLSQDKTGKRLPRIDVNDPESESMLFWQEFRKLLQTHFASHFALIWSYFEWSYQTSKKTDLDLKSIPPVGRWFGLLRRSSKQASRGSSAEKSSNTTATAATAPRVSSSDEESAAIKEADDAMKRLESDSKLDEITLAPQNSFIRRKQHKQIVTAGMKSLSVGEGQQRSVQVQRAPTTS